MKMQKVCKAAADVCFLANLEGTVGLNVDTGRASMPEC